VVLMAFFAQLLASILAVIIGGLVLRWV